MELPYQQLWPNQQFAIQEVQSHLRPGHAVCICGPTGSGKTTIIGEILRFGLPSVLYTNRRMLLDQTAKRLLAHGLAFGVRAAGIEPDFFQPIQLASIQTENSRCIVRNKWQLHDAKLVLIDEAHVNKEGMAQEIIQQYKDRGATIIGFTATPLGIGHLYDDLIVAGCTSDMRAYGALLPAEEYAPDEPDLEHVKRVKTGEYRQGDVVKVIMTHSIFGRVIDHWRTLNPLQKPTLLFAPGVQESIWFAEQFCKNGIQAAHIDGDNVWLGGKFWKSDQEARDAVKKLSEEGDLKIVTNRFVMREGIDWPHLYHGIFATCFGALTSYLQSGGRLLRAFPGMSKVIIQDHGGNRIRHGSLNLDREWDLSVTDYMACQAMEESMRNKKKGETDPEPIVCPRCYQVRTFGPKCHGCGLESTTKSRMVVQADGRLRKAVGDLYKPRKIDTRPKARDIWERVYWRCKRTGKTFSQARGLYAYENGWKYPPEGLPLMPTDSLDWFRKIGDVPMSRLVLPQPENNIAN